VLHYGCYLYFVTTVSANRSGIDPRRLMLTDVASLCSDQPKTNADRLATEPRIDSLTDSSLMPSRSYESIRSSVAAASAARRFLTIADNDSRLSVFLLMQTVCISLLTFVSPSKDARLLRVVLFTPSLPAIVSQSIPARYRLLACFQTSLGILISGNLRIGKESGKESVSPRSKILKSTSPVVPLSKIFNAFSPMNPAFFTLSQKKK